MDSADFNSGLHVWHRKHSPGPAPQPMYSLDQSEWYLAFGTLTSVQTLPLVPEHHHQPNRNSQVQGFMWTHECVCLAWYMPRDIVPESRGNSALVQFSVFLVPLLFEPGNLLLLRAKSFLQDRGCGSAEEHLLAM